MPLSQRLTWLVGPLYMETMRRKTCTAMGTSRVRLQARHFASTCSRSRCKCNQQLMVQRSGQSTGCSVLASKTIDRQFLNQSACKLAWSYTHRADLWYTPNSIFRSHRKVSFDVGLGAAERQCSRVVQPDIPPMLLSPESQMDSIGIILAVSRLSVLCPQLLHHLAQSRLVRILLFPL